MGALLMIGILLFTPADAAEPHPAQAFAVTMIGGLGGVEVKCPFRESEQPETYYCVGFPEELAEFDVFQDRWDAYFARYFDDPDHTPLTLWEESKRHKPGRYVRTYLVHGTKVEALFSNVRGPSDLSFTLWYLDPSRSPKDGDDARLQSQQREETAHSAGGEPDPTANPQVSVKYDCFLVLSKGRSANYEQVRSTLGEGVVRIPDKTTWNSNPPRQIELGSERFFIRLGLSFDSAYPESRQASANLRLFASDDESENLSISSHRDVDVSDGYRIAAAAAGFSADCRGAHLTVTSPLVALNATYPYAEAAVVCTFNCQPEH